MKLNRIVAYLISCLAFASSFFVQDQGDRYFLNSEKQGDRSIHKNKITI